MTDLNPRPNTPAVERFFSPPNIPEVINHYIHQYWNTREPFILTLGGVIGPSLFLLKCINLSFYEMNKTSNKEETPNTTLLAGYALGIMLFGGIAAYSAIKATPKICQFFKDAQDVIGDQLFSRSSPQHND